MGKPELVVPSILPSSSQRCKSRTCAWKPSGTIMKGARESSSTDILIDMSSVASRKAPMGYMPVEDSGTVNMVKKHQGKVGGEFSVAKPNLKCFFRKRVRQWVRVGVLHPKHLS
jgi:hypothetical protein